MGKFELEKLEKIWNVDSETWDYFDSSTNTYYNEEGNPLLSPSEYMVKKRDEE